MRNNLISLKEFSINLSKIHEKHTISNSLKRDSQNFIDNLLRILFPHFSESVSYTPEEIESQFILLKRDLTSIITGLNSFTKEEIQKLTDNFFAEIPGINEALWLDAEAINNGDPAAENIDEVILAYPGFLAITIYRITNLLYKQKIPIVPRILSEYAHQLTGIDINPGAEIGKSFCIDHGTGIVIGETAQIGNNVKMYQGVTLGALSVDKKFSNSKRHPTIEDNVVIYAQAVILGGNTVIGANSIIGGNAWITSSIPPDSVVYNKSEVKLKRTDGLDPIEFYI